MRNMIKWSKLPRNNFIKYYQFHLSVKTRLLKLYRSSRLFDSSACTFFARQMGRDKSIHFMPPTDHEFKDEQSESPFIFWPIIAQSDRSVFQPTLNQFSDTLTCHFAFDEEKKNETAQVKKMMWWPVNTAA